MFTFSNFRYSLATAEEWEKLTGFYPVDCTIKIIKSETDQSFDTDPREYLHEQHQPCLLLIY